MKLKLADDLSLPLDAITQTFLIVGKRGSGKSNTAARLVEQFYRAKLPFVVLDPVDTWWGLKASRNGEEKGLDVYVFGGRKADLPLNAGDGALIADVLCEHRASMVLSVKHLSGRERSAFMVKFAQTLFQKWGGGPLHVVLEEAHELAPQMSGGGSRRDNEDGEAAMLGAFKRLWKLGRASGIGGSAITQRPASLSKDITTQSEILIAHRTIGPQDVAAVGQWVKYHGEKLDILAELPTLPTGEAYIWAPEFPEGKALGLIRSSILLRETYDSASTPKVGEQRVEPKELAPVDLEKLRAKMSATIEKAKADDPRELRKTIADLKGQLSKAAHNMPPKVQPAAAPKIVEKPVLKDSQIAALDTAIGRMEAAIEKAAGLLTKPFANVREQLGALTAAVQSVRQPALPMAPGAVRTVSIGEPRARPVPPARPAREAHDPGDRLPPGEHATLTAALQYDGLDRKRLSVLTGYKRSSRDAYIARLVAKGLIEVNANALFATEAGRETLNGSFEPLPTGADLIEYWRQRLPEGERKTLDVLIVADGQDVPREVIDTNTGYKRSSRDAYLTRLKARGLVEFRGRGMVSASAELFA